MNFYKLLHLVFGEYVFFLESRDFPRFSSLLLKNNISFWGVEHGEEGVFLHSSLFSAESACTLAEQNGVRLTLCKKRGLPFVLARYRKRLGLLFGALIFMLSVFASQLFVWDIEISGNREISTRDIEDALEDIGISVGSFIPNIDRLAKANELLIECRELSSAAITLNGTHITVSVLERKGIPEIIDKSGFYNVVSEYDGIILDIDALQGTPEVREGDAVFAGELLINSFMESKNGAVTPTHARGVVYAAVKEEFSVEIPLSRMSKVYSGRSETKKAYRLLGWEIPFASSLESEYEYFDSVCSERDILLFGFIKLPLREYRVTYSEYTPLYRDIDASEAEILANEALADYFAELDLEILECKSEFLCDKEKGSCLLKAEAFVKRNIAKEVPFSVIDYKISERFETESE